MRVRAFELPYLLKLAGEFELLTEAAKKPKVVKFPDGCLILGEFGSKEVEEAIWKELNNKPVNLIINDPPYSNILNPNEKKFGGGQMWDKDVSADDYIRWTKESLKFLAKQGSCYFWGAIGKPKKPRVFFEYLATVEDKTGLNLFNLITWSKKRGFGTKFNYLFTREECAWLVNGDRPAIFNIPLLEAKRPYKGFNKDYPAKSEHYRRTNVWTDINEKFSQKLHVCEKPVRLAEVMIETNTRPGMYVADFFAGSGSTGEACLNTGRKFILVEKDPANFQIIINRLKNYYKSK